MPRTSTGKAASFTTRPTVGSRNAGVQTAGLVRASGTPIIRSLVTIAKTLLSRGNAVRVPRSVKEVSVPRIGVKLIVKELKNIGSSLKKVTLLMSKGGSKSKLDRVSKSKPTIRSLRIPIRTFGNRTINSVRASPKSTRSSMSLAKRGFNMATNVAELIWQVITTAVKKFLSFLPVIVVAAVLVKRNWKAISAWGKEMWTNVIAQLETFGGKIWKWFSESFPKTAKALQPIIDFIGKVRDAFKSGNWDEVVKDIKKGVKWVVGKFINYTIWMRGQMWEGLKWMWKKLPGWFKEGWGFLQKHVPEWMKSLGNWFTQSWDDLKRSVPEWMKSLGNWFTQSWNGLKDLVGPWMTQLGSWFNIAWEGLKILAPIWRDQLAKWFGETWDSLKDEVPKWVNKIGMWIGDAWQLLSKYASIWASKLSGWFSSGWEYLKDEVPKWVEKLGMWFGASWESLKTNVPIWIGKMGTWFTDSWATMKEVVPKLVNRLGEWFVESWSTMKEVVPIMWNKMKEWFKNMISGEGGLWEKFTTGFKKGQETVKASETQITKDERATIPGMPGAPPVQPATPGTIKPVPITMRTAPNLVPRRDNSGSGKMAVIQSAAGGQALSPTVLMPDLSTDTGDVGLLMLSRGIA